MFWKQLQPNVTRVTTLLYLLVVLSPTPTKDPPKLLSQPPQPLPSPTSFQPPLNISRPPKHHTKSIMMADVQHATAPPIEASQPRQIPTKTTAPLQIPPPTQVALPPPPSASRIRNSHLILDSFSPVNQNGSFEFDRVLKSGYVQKRTRKTKVSLQPVYPASSRHADSCYRIGNQYSSYYDPIPFPSTKTRTKGN